MHIFYCFFGTLAGFFIAFSKQALVTFAVASLFVVLIAYIGDPYIVEPALIVGPARAIANGLISLHSLRKSIHIAPSTFVKVRQKES